MKAAFDWPGEKAGWAAASQSIGVGHRDQSATRRVQELRVAGMNSADVAYSAAANDFPRCERQMIRAIFDPDIASGRKVPPPELLMRYPTREFPDRPETGRPATGRLSTGRPPTGWRSRPNSGASVHSAASRRSSSASAAGSAIARPLATPGPPPGYYRQAHTPNYMYQTSSSRIGAPGFVKPEPCPGREAWMLGRGGGQQSSFDSCLVHKAQWVPLTVMT